MRLITINHCLHLHSPYLCTRTIFCSIKLRERRTRPPINRMYNFPRRIIVFTYPYVHLKVGAQQANKRQHKKKKYIKKVYWNHKEAPRTSVFCRAVWKCLAFNPSNQQVFAKYFSGITKQNIVTISSFQLIAALERANSSSSINARCNGHSLFSFCFVVLHACRRDYLSRALNNTPFFAIIRSKRKLPSVRHQQINYIKNTLCEYKMMILCLRPQLAN